MGQIDDVAERYVEDYGRLEPLGATEALIKGHDDRLTDLSVEGFAALEATTPETERERVAEEAMQERLVLGVERYKAGEATSELNVIFQLPAQHPPRQRDDPLRGQRAGVVRAAAIAAGPVASTGPWTGCTR